MADFASLGEMLVIELDGGQHVERKDQDAARTRWLADRGYRVLRLWNGRQAVVARPRVRGCDAFAAVSLDARHAAHAPLRRVKQF
jgi:hypothetical protein